MNSRAAHFIMEPCTIVNSARNARLVECRPLRDGNLRALPHVFTSGKGNAPGPQFMLLVSYCSRESTSPCRYVNLMHCTRRHTSSAQSSSLFSSVESITTEPGLALQST